MEYICQNPTCGKKFSRNGKRVARFCSIACKAEWQRTQKPVDKAWLEQKYVVEGLSTYAIAKLVNRNPKQVWHWINDYGIPLRERTWDTQQGVQPYHDGDWLRTEYVDKKRSAGEIAQQFGVKDATIIHFLKMFKIKRRNTSEARSVKHWGNEGEKNPMFGKRGPLSSNWKGGSTPERQACYSSIAWANAVKAVWKRDKGTCQRCGARKKWKDKTLIMHIHHIISFIKPETRTDPDNLVLLCIDCHHFVHSPKNVNKEFISE